MADVLVYATDSRADVARSLLGAACQATGTSVHLDLYGTGSLYQRLGPRHAPPPPDLVMWFGPFAAGAAAIDGFLQSYQPTRVAEGILHDPDWKWITLDYSAIGVMGSSPVSSWTDLASVPRLAMPDPERSEVGMAILLSMLDRARQVDSDVERGWSWWQQRVDTGLLLAEDEASASQLVANGRATHALTLKSAGAALSGLAPLPHAVGIAGASRNLDATRRLVDWMCSESAGAVLKLSPWQATSNGLAALLESAPALDVEWARLQYTQVRQRWAESGFGPTVAR